MAYQLDLWHFFREGKGRHLAAVPAFVAVISGATALTLSTQTMTMTMTMAASETTSAIFKKCSGGHRVTCVVDGGTLWIDGTKIRVADIDAPEISEPKCASELALGNPAT